MSTNPGEARNAARIRRRWRRLWCGHYFVMETGLLDAHPFTTWICQRGCGKRKLMFADTIPMSYIEPWETVVNDRVVPRG